MTHSSLRLPQGMSTRCHDLIFSNIRDVDQSAWFGSAVQLLGTKYRQNLVAGLVLSIGSSIASVVSWNPASLKHADS